MVGSVRSNAADGISARASNGSKVVYTLAHVLRLEYRELHRHDPKKKMRRALRQAGTAVHETKQQQPLADPSLAPADDRARDQRMKQAEKAPSHQSDNVRDAEELRELWDDVHNPSGDGRTALCLSGGGVRSAAFNLGVLQGLARLDLLNRFHYLSTVSGGGYIGCWLSAWRHRCEKGISDILRGLSGLIASAMLRFRRECHMQ
jgi:Patatin-like phospholipase